MSSSKRPWYKWWPKDFVTDEKVQSLSPLSELVYRRLLDIMWQSKTGRLLNVCLRLANTAGNGLTQEQFKNCWEEIQTEGFELFKITPDGKWIYSERLLTQLQSVEIKRESGKKGGLESAKQRAKQTASKSQAKVKQTLKQRSTDTDTDTEVKIRALSSKLNRPPYSEIINFLNLKTKKKFKPDAKGTKRLIKARWNDGYTLGDFKSVISKKCAVWMSDDKMHPYLRPETLFAANHFESYLNDTDSGFDFESERLVSL